MLLTCQLPVLYNHNMCNKLLYYQSNNTDCIAENLLEIYIMSLMSLMSQSGLGHSATDGLGSDASAQGLPHRPQVPSASTPCSRQCRQTFFAISIASLCSFVMKSASHTALLHAELHSGGNMGILTPHSAGTLKADHSCFLLAVSPTRHAPVAAECLLLSSLPPLLSPHQSLPGGAASSTPPR